MRIIIYSILFCLINSISFSQIGIVESFSKISSTEGNFTGDLSDGDYFAICQTIGDLDNDGYEDIAVGVRNDDDGGSNRGAVWILFLNQDRTVKSYQKISDTEGNFTGILDDDDQFGTSISNVGDIDNDNIPDLAVGAWGDDDDTNNSGAVWILFMNTDGTVKNHQKISATEGGIIGLTENRLFGMSTCELGDLDSDGTPDIAVGSPNYDNDGGFNHGCVWILFLNPEGTVKSQQKINDYNGNFNVTLNNGDKFGYGLANIGDINDDGIIDICASAIYTDDGAYDAGALYILFLDTDGTVKSHQKISATDGNFEQVIDENDQIGYSNTGIGDIDSDGVEDMVMSGYRDDDGGTDRGAVWVLLLNDNGTVKSSQKISSSEGGFTGTLDDSDFFGMFISAFKSAKKEISVGALKDDDGGYDRGAVWIQNLLDNFPQNQLSADYDSICLGEWSGNIFVSKMTGTITDWEKRLDNGSWQSVGFTGEIFHEIPTETGKWDYRVEYNEGTLYSTIDSIFVNPNSEAGIASTNENTVCEGSSITLTLTDYFGTIQWQESTDAMNWTDISGANEDNYVGNPTFNTYYRAFVANGTCFDISNTIEIEVIPNAEAGTAGASEYTICEGSSTTLTLTDYFGTIQWQESTNNLDWIDIPDADENSFVCYPTINTFYRAVLNYNICANDTSNTIEIIVDENSIAGTATSDEDVICTGNTLTLTLIDYLGGIQWQVSTNNVNWTDIPEAYENSYVCNPIIHSYYRAVVSNGTCYNFSNTIEIEVVQEPVSDFQYNTNYQIVSFENSSLNSTDYSWDFGDGNSSTFENPIHTYNASGTYTVTLTALNGICDEDSHTEDILVTYLGINSFENEIKVLPNPNNGLFQIDFGTSNQIPKTITIVNSIGVVIYTKEIRSTLKEIDLSQFPAGVYLYEIQMNNKMFKGKIIIL